MWRKWRVISKSLSTFVIFNVYKNKKYTMTYIVKWEELKVVEKRRIIWTTKN